MAVRDTPRRLRKVVGTLVLIAGLVLLMVRFAEHAA